MREAIAQKDAESLQDVRDAGREHCMCGYRISRYTFKLATAGEKLSSRRLWSGGIVRVFHRIEREILP